MFKNFHDPNVIKKFNEIQGRILESGWSGIIKKYHPDINIGHPKACDLFLAYRDIFNNMKKRAIVKASNDLTEKYNEIQLDILNKGILFFKDGGATINGIDIVTYSEIYNAMKEVLTIS